MQNKLIILKDLYSHLGNRMTKDQYYQLCQIKDDQAILAYSEHKKQVQYAFECARSVVHMIKEPKQTKTAQECLSLVAKWLDFPNKVTKDQLRDAADIVYCAVYDTHAAYYAVRAAGYAATAAGYAVARAAGYAAEVVAATAVYAARYAVDAAPNKQAQKDFNFSFLMELIQNENSQIQGRRSRSNGPSEFDKV